MRLGDIMKVWFVLALACAAVSASTADAAVAVTVKGDHIACRMKPGHSRGKADAVRSPDGHTVAYIRFARSDALPPDQEAGTLWIGDCHGGHTHLLLPAQFQGKSDGEQWVTLSWPIFSLDGRQVYVSAGYGGSSLLVQRVDVVTGRHTFVVAAEMNGLIRNGPYRGDLFATQHTSLKDKSGAEYAGYPYYVFSPDGAEIKRIDGSENWDEHARDAWLRRQGRQVR